VTKRCPGNGFISWNCVGASHASRNGYAAEAYREISSARENIMIRSVVGAVFGIAAFVSAEAEANGLFEKDWQFQDAATLTARGTLEDVRLRQAGGYYNSFAPGSTTTNSNISIGNMTSVTAGNQTTVGLSGGQTNSGTQTTAGELNGTISSLSGH
jgi:hypothetical protein